MKVPRRMIFSGDFTQAARLKGLADSILRTTKGERDLRGLNEHWKTKRFTGGVVIEAYAGFNNDDVVRVYVPPQNIPANPPILKCFANTGMALAQIIGIAGYTLVAEGEGFVDPVTDMRISAYPVGYYGTKTIRYDVGVCDGHGEYVLYEEVPSTDFTVHKPGAIVLAIMNRTVNVPERQIYRNTEHPCAEQPFAWELRELPDVIAIIPIKTSLELVERWQ